jgi:hypothetical protein
MIPMLEVACPVDHSRPEIFLFGHGQIRRKIDAVMVFPTPIFWLEKN